jgi:hypothetical protein
MRPSYIYHQVHAVTSIIGTLATLYWLIRGDNRSSYTITLIILLLSLSWGIHALVHFFEEINYDYQPLKGKNIVHDYPVYR